jgi:hypothetical protein
LATISDRRSLNENTLCFPAPPGEQISDAPLDPFKWILNRRSPGERTAMDPDESPKKQLLEKQLPGHFICRWGVGEAESI